MKEEGLGIARLCSFKPTRNLYLPVVCILIAFTLHIRKVLIDYRKSDEKVLIKQEYVNGLWDLENIASTNLYTRSCQAGISCLAEMSRLAATFFMT